MIRETLTSTLPAPTAFALLSGALRRAVRFGSLGVIDPWGERQVFGTGGPPMATVRISDPEEPAKLLANPQLRAGEAYMEGKLVLEEGSLRDLLQVLVAAGAEMAQDAELVGKMAAPFRKVLHNPIAKSRRNAAHHYDLSGELYRLFLDPDMQYSCAYFPNGDETLKEAQTKKKRHIAAKLRLEPGLRVLDIGSGWGGFALELARSFGVEVDGITLSQEQLAVARRRVEEAGLSERVRFHLRDYRQEAGNYHRIVSVGMFEHVGPLHYEEFFRVISRLLAPKGVALIHAIGQRGPPGRGGNEWIEKHIFPGAYCPALSEVIAAIERTDLWVTDVEILRLHYAETLRCWSERFAAQRSAAAALYDERFCRMWEFYLAACEAAFRVGGLMVFQIQLAREHGAVPLTRDYMFEAEREMAADR